MTSSALTEKLPTSARFEEYRGVRTVGAYTNATAEFQALRTRCGLFDLSWRAKIVITGSDRTRWMNGMVTNNVRDLAPGTGTYAFLLNPQGKIQGDMYVYNRGEYLLVDTDQSQVTKMLEIFDHFIIMDDVEVTNSSDKLTAIGIMGQEARKIVAAAAFSVRDLDPLQGIDVVRQEIGMTVSRTDNPVTTSYEIWLAPERLGAVWEALQAAGATPVGSQALELFRIACGIPRFGQDIREKDLPQETEQARALNFNKGCYVGQEIVERIRSRGAVHRMFTGFKVMAGPLPAPGSKLHADSKDVGEITSVASLPYPNDELRVALGYVRREKGQPGTILQSDTSQLSATEVPFQEIFKS